MKISKLIKKLNNVKNSEGDINVMLSSEGQWHVINAIYSYNISENTKDGVKYCILETENIPKNALKIYFKEAY